VRVVAVCDVDRQRRDRALERVSDAYGSSDCATYVDFRELLARDDIDAVIIATPDHWHSIPAIAACEAGKDVYCEKPMTLTISEGRAMVNAARENERVFQTGSQQRSGFFFRHGVELVRNGYIGEVKSIIVGVHGHAGYCDLPAEPMREGLDWEMWLGQAPWRPYNYRIWRSWRSYWDYSGGSVTDWGAHQFDIAQWALGMDESGPVEVRPPEDGHEIRAVYGNGVTVERHEPVDYSEYSIKVIGSEGEVEMHREWLRTKPRSLRYATIKPGEERVYYSDDHKGNFLDCIRSRKKCIADVDIGHRSVSVCHLGNIAYRLGRRLKWDPVKERFVGDDEADRMLSRAKRSPWHM
jgi:predicted dehydrogenase